VRLWEAAHRGRPTRAKAFLFLIVRNLMIDRLRQKRLVCIDSVADPDQLDVSDGAPTPERHVAGRQDLRRLQACMDDLPPRTRQILMLRKVEGYAQREVAMLLGVTEEAVEHQVSRGVRQVKRAFTRNTRRR
jgi:RNA polymerase sigma-70 factor (ECF subfamily)